MYGSYTTIDAPTENKEEALAFLIEEFDKIGGTVRKVFNTHDFGRYPSFEIDYPEGMEDIDEDEEYEDDANKQLADKKRDWHVSANQVEEAYGEKFSEWL